MYKSLLYIALFTLVMGCEQAVVHGPIGDAQVTITELRSGTLVASGEHTDGLQAVRARWEDYDTFEDLVALALLGVYSSAELTLDEDIWYLVTLQGGVDYDVNGDLLRDENPAAIQGPIRALLTGEQLLNRGFTIGTLSESAWQWLREHYQVMTDAELAAALDQFAIALVTNIYEPALGQLNYHDLLTWNPMYFSAESFKGSLASLAAMEDAIASGATDSERLAIVQAMVSLKVPVGASDAWFREQVSPHIAQQKCIACHTEDGIAAATDHILVNDSDLDHLDINTDMYAALVESLGVQAILNKAQGLNHGGDVQVVAGSEDYQALTTYLNLLDGSNQEGEVQDDLLEAYALASPAATMRRAALLLAGSLPTVSVVDEAALAVQVRALMTGPGFHQFLIEGANDRLLTDKWIEDIPVEVFFQPFFPDLANTAAELSESGATEPIYELIEGTSFGIAREPLELIAHVVENDLPYTEILTANYTMVNPQLALAYRADVSFADSENIDQWQLATIEGYTRIDESTVYEEAMDFGAHVSGGLPTNYPHAGVLNTAGWLARYPSTATNRNRARSRWTWYHFLGFDIERSAPRTTDPAALSDTDNPTLKNPNCAVCHEIMDPVAGAYQNYGDEGFYKDKFGGQDSLPRLYKQERDSEDPYQFGDTWYRDMRAVGFDGAVYANTENTLQSLAADIALDARFATGTVKFWWPALMGEEVARAPADPADADYAERLALFQAQSAALDALASGFSQGFDGGAAYNLKDLLVQMVISPWFRADRRSEEASTEDAALLALGTGKLLTPEQLDRKTEAVTGYRWYEREHRGVTSSQLTDTYRLFYGGIDSDGVTARATEMTALMSTVVEAQPLQMACILVAIEFNTPQASRKMFTQVDKSEHENNAEPALRRQLQLLHETFLGESLAVDDAEIDRALRLFIETRSDRWAQNYATQLDGDSSESCPFQFFDSQQLDLSDPRHTLNTWVSMLIYYMTDYRYVYE